MSTVPNPSNTNIIKRWEVFMAEKSMFTRNLSKFQPALRCRFSWKSRNAAKILLNFTDLSEFSTGHWPDLKSYFESNDIIEAKEELLALSFTWYGILLPLWTKIAGANVVVTVDLFREFIRLADNIVDSRSIIDACDPVSKKFLRVKFDDANSGIMRTSEISIRRFIFDQIVIECSYRFPERFVVTVVNIMKVMRNYAFKFMED
jgi:hypothetical protein